MQSHLPGIYQIDHPAGRPAALVFDSPHSGRIYPTDFNYTCDPALLAKAEDTFVDELFAGVPHHGGTLLNALFPRTYIDVNRAEDDIDTHLLSESWPHPISGEGRAAAGHGLVRRLIRPGFSIYERKLSLAEIEARLAGYYRPYHAALKTLLDESCAAHGQVIHINCHSMPSTSALGPLGTPVDMVLGTRDGTSCSAGFARELKNFLKHLGYRVSVNTPYKGMEILRRSGDPQRARQSLQLEISKALYLEEARNEKSSGFFELQKNLEKMTGFIRDYAEASQMPLAAD